MSQMSQFQTISNFMGAFAGGLRPNKFEVSHDIPGTKNAKLMYHIRAATMPPSVMTTINVPYRGRIFKLPGIRTYQTWQITVLDDTNKLYEAYHKWSSNIKTHTSNITNMPSKPPDYSFKSLMPDVTIKQLDYNGVDFRKITLKHAWPNNIGPLNLDMENNDTILTFTVDMEYQWFEIP